MSLNNNESKYLINDKNDDITDTILAKNKNSESATSRNIFNYKNLDHFMIDAVLNFPEMFIPMKQDELQTLCPSYKFAEILPADKVIDKHDRLKIQMSTNESNSNNIEKTNPMNADHREYFKTNEDHKKIKKKNLSLQLSNNNNTNILTEFAELTTDEDLLRIQKEIIESKSQTPLSGRKLIHNQDDGSSPYLHCFRYFSQ
ncbi:hypothetical protein HZS_1260, partial [Henneguya salminicola]